MANVWISQLCVDNLLREIEKFSPLETGGSFFGYVGDNGDVVITDLIHAGPKAKRRRYSFEPDQVFQHAEMARLFELNGGRTSYLGDWHSHPLSSPELSLRDERTLLKVACSADAQCPHPIMMVIGYFPEQWTINCVRFKHGKKMIWPFFSCHYETLNVIFD
ncbi:Mov34/MPN/PAD-1 family protein [Alkalimonas collagenimarina]|uniref:Mov34/MPN/PAD-1 family protein n=1 Tax=Alkalimonas collagenimarina TaxID=400390 RepID=A0ABT9GWZ3_9GAMM|nr:Mov34/MPN/PAD-1 family protein [Alkalimonas collagenimarina]MDP4535580.1 Mov34/MPN/PAD-1 family protein [Alkalimonas collagenimarina]